MDFDLKFCFVHHYICPSCWLQSSSSIQIHSFPIISISHCNHPHRSNPGNFQSLNYQTLYCPTDAYNIKQRTVIPFITSFNNWIKNKLATTITEMIFLILFLNFPWWVFKALNATCGDNKLHDTRKWVMVTNKWRYVKHYQFFYNKSACEKLFWSSQIPYYYSVKVMHSSEKGNKNDSWQWIMKCPKN